MVTRQAKHPSGLTVTFDESAHTYTVDQTGRQLTSVTRFIDQFFPKFDAQATAQKCAGRGKYAGMGVDAVLHAWDKEKQRGQREGKAVHGFAEALMNNWPADRRPVAQSPREGLLFQSATKAVLMLEERFDFVGTEVIVFSPDLGLAGMIDWLYRDPGSGTGPGEIVIGDWKQNKEIKKSAMEKCLAPIDDLDACDWVKYCLQLNIYQEICMAEGYFPGEKYRRALVHLTESSAVPFKVPDMRDWVLEMLASFLPTGSRQVIE
jgi:hypothetical protein